MGSRWNVSGRRLSSGAEQQRIRLRRADDARLGIRRSGRRVAHHSVAFGSEHIMSGGYPDRERLLTRSNSGEPVYGAPVTERETPSRVESDGTAEITFDPVWLVLRRPKPNLKPPSYFAAGALSVGESQIRFGPSSSSLLWPGRQPNDINRTLERVTKVATRRYGWGLVPRFVAVTYETDEGPGVTYFNDGGWSGWRPLLTGSNRRMAKAIRDRLQLQQDPDRRRLPRT